MIPRLRNAIARSSGWVLVPFAGGTALLTYISMYAFRKPFTAATYESIVGWEHVLDFKTALLLSQVAGYALSKFIGIKVISEMTPGKRVVTLIGLVSTAWLALLALPLLPTGYAFVALFFNGLPLGMVWGLVFSFLEGRRLTEVLGAILCASFIVGSGIVKSVGLWLLLEFHVPELWMPFAVGAIFMPLLVIFSVLMSAIPAPSESDVAQRQERVPIYGPDRWAFARKYALGLVALIVSYVALTAIRDFTDSFAAEIFSAIGYGETPSIFATTGLLVSVIVLVAVALIFLVNSNYRAVMINHAFIATGFATLVLASLAFERGWISGLVWFVLVNAGTYIAYVPFNCVIFDRLVAATRDLANAGFLIYLADSFGYLGSIAILLYKSLGSPDTSWLSFVIDGSYFVGTIGVSLVAVSAFYFKRTLLPGREGRAYA